MKRSGVPTSPMVTSFSYHMDPGLSSCLGQAQSRTHFTTRGETSSTFRNFFYASTYDLITSGYKKLGKVQQSIHSCPLVD